ncbi:hypothetical protein NSK11_contig00006-0006 [Nocardia seriolae]|uniref:Uncharacterized protein n=1 Tax=Nocardia seriolae TaxID=37332 RepID=A0ABC9YLX3_9NOCA|nr:hypothetical protein NS07_v2contig00004-0006 [Nocardia seriolae]GAP26410.1 hypothetical protein NSK11_contig00006-0006 [Nocardia seriolae]
MEFRTCAESVSGVIHIIHNLIHRWTADRFVRDSAISSRISSGRPIRKSPPRSGAADPRARVSEGPIQSDAAGRLVVPFGPEKNDNTTEKRKSWAGPGKIGSLAL